MDRSDSCTGRAAGATVLVIDSDPGVAVAVGSASQRWAAERSRALTTMIGPRLRTGGGEGEPLAPAGQHLLLHGVVDAHRVASEVNATLLARLDDFTSSAP
ncbi:hypothetical protein ACIRVK_43250 [Streptomyces sp. NPDC101152]|uniref:hypothetical protein n=1 Tax=Streptomyces sp. NPDC101152 TaxID=3366116 RepID=UPI00382D8738